MKTGKRDCRSCLWCDQCAGEICDDYSPIDDLAEDIYVKDLDDRAAVYQEMINDYADCEVETLD